jgi:hypothetical protein
LGYHLVNSGVFVLTVLIFYRALHKLGLPRLLSVSIPLVYAVLPHYFADRFWIAASHANVSMALYFLSLYSHVRAMRTRGRRLWYWKLLSIFALI